VWTKILLMLIIIVLRGGVTSISILLIYHK
jgi:hypothetical protein